MSETPQSFDPYLEWLGIRDPQRPPNHYRLLGVEPFEADAKVIASAADRQMAHVRTFQGGKHSDLSQQILNELAAAKLCLLKPERKSQYDAQLREQLAPPVAPPPEPVIPPAAKADGSGPDPIRIVTDAAPARPAAGKKPPRPGDSPLAYTVRRPARRVSPLMWALPGVGVVIVVILVVALAMRTRPGDDGLPPADPIAHGDPVQPPDPPADVLPPAANGTDQGDDNGNGNDSATSDPANGNGGDNDAPPPAPPPWNAPRPRGGSVDLPGVEVAATPPVRGPLLDVLIALKGRDLTAAETNLGQANAAAANPADHESVQRVQATVDYLRRFWEAADQALAALQPGDMLAYRGEEVSVAAVNLSDVELLSSGGERKRFPTARQEIDADLAVALVQRQVPGGGPALLCMLAAFEAIDQQGNPAQAAALLQQAASQGVPAELIALRVNVAGETTTDPSPPSDTQPARPALDLPDLAPRSRLPADRAAVPSTAEQREALQLVREVYKTQLAQTDPKARSELAQRLIREGIETRGKPAAQFVLFDQAREIATEIGDLETALSAVAELERRFEVDGVEQRRQILVTIGRRIRTGGPLAEKFVSEALALAEQAAADRNYAAAGRYAAATLEALRSLRDAVLNRRIQDFQQKAEYQRRGHELAQLAIERLKTEPENALAHSALGSYLCFGEGDFDRGLPHLARSQDENLRPLAEKDLARPDKPADQVALADAWWEYGKGEQVNPPATPQERAAQGRAVHWYEAALPRLSGLEETRVKNRLEKYQLVQAGITPGTRIGAVEPGNVALARNGTVVRGVQVGADQLIDGNSTRYDFAGGYAFSPIPCEWTIEFPKVFLLREIRFLLWDKDNRHYRYQVAVSADGKSFSPIADRSQGQWRSWQKIEFSARPVKAVKLFGLHNSFDNNFHVVEFEAYCIPPN